MPSADPNVIPSSRGGAERYRRGGEESQPAGGEPVTDIGKYVVIWKRQGDDWKLHIDIWNTNSPLPTP